MRVSKSSKTSRISKRKASGRPAPGGGVPWVALLVCAFVLAAAGFTFSRYVDARGYVWFGDAEAHFNIARRVLDSRTPGPEQLGTVWLPLPHAVLLPFIRYDDWWQTGAAALIPGLTAYLAAGLFLFGASRLAFGNTAAAVTATLLFACNPNLLYLQAIPMTEPLMFAGLNGLLLATVWFARTRSLAAVVLAGVMSNAASMTRYEGWFLIPFVAIYFVLAGGSRRWLAAVLFCIIASAGPAAWLAHNLYYYSNPLEFYTSPYSAKGIYQRALDAGMAKYPGDHDWTKALKYFIAAAQSNAGPVLCVVALVGAVGALLRRSFWPLAFLLLSPVFYVISMYSSGTPIFLPHLWPHSYYNTRYGLAALPLLAFCAAGLTATAPERFRTPVTALLLVLCVAPWLAYPRPDSWITWKESQVNEQVRSIWTREAAAYLRERVHPRDSILASFGKLTGVFREAGIPLRRVVHEGNGPEWYGAMARPDLLMNEEWAVTMPADAVSAAILKARKSGPHYELVKRIEVKGEVVEIYKRSAKLP